MHWVRHRSESAGDLRAIARDVLTAAGGMAQFAFVGLSGSLVAGLGHGMSDVDIYLVPRGEGGHRPKRHPHAGTLR